MPDRADVELVVAVGREVVLDEHAAARAQRQAITMRRTASTPDRAIVVAAGACASGSPTALTLTTRAAAMYWSRNDGDTAARRRRCRSRRLVVLRQQRSHVDLDAQQAVDRARVLGAVQAMQARRSPGSGSVGRSLVEACFHPADELLAGSPRPAAALPAAASAAAQLAHGLLPTPRHPPECVPAAWCRRPRRRPSRCRCGSRNSISRAWRNVAAPSPASCRPEAKRRSAGCNSSSFR